MGAGASAALWMKLSPVQGCGTVGPTLPPDGNNTALLTRLAGGLLPYAPTYSSWLDCWSQLHKEVSATMGCPLWGCCGVTGSPERPPC